ncbi:arf-GAP domain and FG repeat-containing protein 1 isoform X2 [Sitodiplosis mosellana]|uniref:arf-GAP domain and FG repeat-containing protein 1 isoform X2 n=1 Tax=Sitodiplosis mosellana TaxID=263140 RepID=UPI0024453731|nr:arf-GAP domain and FG repeat-containing protein 1 isoform X2 [Sitodiplosis mosellana]
MAVVRKKQDDKMLKILRELVSLSGNKQCFDCNQKGPTYVNMTIGSFVCTRCSGVLRGLTPPHRVKSISMATFTTEEIDFIKAHGNELCAKTWLGLWDPKRVHTQDQRELIIDKYERKRYYLEPASPLKSITNTAQLAPSQKQQQTQLNSATLLTNGTAKSIEENNSNLWTSNASMNGKTSNSSRWKMDLLSSNDNNSLFNNHISAPVATNGTRPNGSTNNTNGTNGLSLNGNKSMDAKTNGFHLPPPASNGDKNNKNLFTPDTDFVADFSSANIFDALNNKPSINKNNTSSTTNKPILLQGNGHSNANHHANGIELTNGNRTNGNTTTDVNKNFDENFADFEHNTIYNAAGLPMSLSSTSNSLKSSGTFNSNSSINSTPSVDRYAALKDLDEQLREIKEKDTHNQNTLTAATPANPFNLSSSPSAQPNPFQTQSAPLWFGDQQGLTTPAQPMYPMTNGMTNGNGNGFHDQSTFGMNGMNGSVFNGNGLHYPKVTDTNLFNGSSLNMNNGFPQKNPFAAPVLNATTNPFL